MTEPSIADYDQLEAPRHARAGASKSPGRPDSREGAPLASKHPAVPSGAPEMLTFASSALLARAHSDSGCAIRTSDGRKSGGGWGCRRLRSSPLSAAA
jgi:hypothetical protein